MLHVQTGTCRECSCPTSMSLMVGVHAGALTGMANASMCFVSAGSQPLPSPPSLLGACCFLLSCFR